MSKETYVIKNHLGVVIDEMWADSSSHALEIRASRAVVPTCKGLSLAELRDKGYTAEAKAAVLKPLREPVVSHSEMADRIAELEAYIQKHVGATHCESSPEQQEIARLEAEVERLREKIKSLPDKIERRTVAAMQRQAVNCGIASTCSVAKWWAASFGRDEQEKKESEAGP